MVTSLSSNIFPVVYLQHQSLWIQRCSDHLQITHKYSGSSLQLSSLASLFTFTWNQQREEAWFCCLNGEKRAEKLLGCIPGTFSSLLCGLGLLLSALIQPAIAAPDSCVGSQKPAHVSGTPGVWVLLSLGLHLRVPGVLVLGCHIYHVPGPKKTWIRMRNEDEYTCIWVSCCYFVIKTKAQHENTHPEHRLSQCLVCNNEKNRCCFGWCIVYLWRILLY